VCSVWPKQNKRFVQTCWHVKCDIGQVNNLTPDLSVLIPYLSRFICLNTLAPDLSTFTLTGLYWPVTYDIIFPCRFSPSRCQTCQRSCTSSTYPTRRREWGRRRCTAGRREPGAIVVDTVTQVGEWLKSQRCQRMSLSISGEPTEPISQVAPQLGPCAINRRRYLIMPRLFIISSICWHTL